MSGWDGKRENRSVGLTAEVGDIDVESIRTYLESMVNVMHIYGMQIDILCEPSSRENAALAKLIPK